MSDILTIDQFLGCVNQKFDIMLAGGETYSLVLACVEALTVADQPSQRAPFSLIFTHQRVDAYLPQGTYLLENEQLGSHSIFLVPLSPDSSGMRYQAIFS